MRILVACEESGTLTDRLIAAGHDAWSCDFLSTRGNNPDKHLQCDAFDILDQGWDALIFFYTCRYMANSGAKHLYIGMKKENGINPERWKLMEKAANDFKKFLNSDIEVVIGENPVMHGHAKKIIGVQQSQIIQPWQHGHGEQKATCLWLKGRPLLEPSNIVEGREQRVWKMAPGPNRERDRSETYNGIADAMVAQWFPPDVSGEKK